MENIKEEKSSIKTASSTNNKYPPVSFFRLVYQVGDAVDNLYLIIGIIGSLGMGTAMPLFSFVFGTTINSFGANTGGTFVDQINIMVLRFVYVSLGVFCVSFIMITFFTLNGKRIIMKLKSKYFETIMKQEQGYFDSENPFEYSTKVQNQTKIIESGLGDKVGNALMSLSMFVAAFVMGFTTSWKLSLALLSIVPMMGIGGYFFTLKLMEGTQQKEKEYEKAGGLAEEVIFNVKTVASFGNMDQEVKRFDEVLVNSMEAAISNGLTSGLGMGIVFALIYIAYAVAIWYGAYLIANKSWNSNTNANFQAGDVLTVLFSIIFGSFALGQASPNLKAINDGLVAAGELFWLIDRKPQINLENSTLKPNKSEMKGQINFQDVTFAYPFLPKKGNNTEHEKKINKTPDKTKVIDPSEEKAEINPSEEKRTNILQNFSFDFEAGKKIAIVGKSGSGKSTVVSLIERLYDINSGSITIDGIDIKQYDLDYLRTTIGYVPQEPVLFNISIKENIEFGRELTDDQIKTACDKAHATEFIEKISDKLNYKVGIKGSKLSGGQKQRIAIARAIANDPKILILDEATSALDNESEKIVQKALDTISNGVTTIIIAHRLTTIMNADKIIVMKKGQIIEAGNHDELLKLGKKYSKLIKNQLGNNNDSYRKESINTDRNNIVKTLENENDPLNDINKIDNTLKVDEVDLKQSDEEIMEKQKIEEEKFNKSKDKLLGFLSESKGTIFLSAFFSSCSGAVWPVYGVVLGISIGVLSGPIPTKVYDDGFFMAMMFLVIAGCAAISITFQNYGFSKIGEILTRLMRKSIYEKYLSLQIGYFDLPDNTPGSLLTKLSTDSTKINGVALSMVGISVQSIVMLLIGIILGFYYDWRLSLINIGFIPLILFNSAMHFKMQAGYTNADRSLEIEAGAILSESVINTKTIFSYNMQSTVVKLYTKIITSKSKDLNCQAITNGLFFGFSQFIVFIIYAVLFYAGGQFMAKGDLTINSMMSAIFAILFAAFGLGMSQQYVSDYAGSKTALMNLCTILDEKTEIDPYESGKVKTEDVEFDGSIEFKNVKFSYPTRKNQTVLNNISFKIEAGSSVAFVGKSGCGKSTIIQLLERFYDVTEGEIKISGKNIKDYDLISYRKKVGLVMQEPVLFKRSLKENVRYGKLNANDEEITIACERAYINDLVKKDDSTTPISGGEKQRIAIARSIIKDPKILLFDEATSALDEKSEEIVQKTLNEIMKCRTSITIAHRLSTIVNSNMIFVMENGQIVENGTHNELLEKRGKYHSLYHGNSKK